jgi:hypothetical protein
LHDDQAWRLPENAETHSSAAIRVQLTEFNTLDDLMGPIFADLCCCTAETLAKVLRLMQLRVFKRVLKSLSLARK